MRPLMRYPVTGTDAPWYVESRSTKRHRAANGSCGICGEYDGLLHARCWWLWLTEERVSRGYHDGEQQVEPDEDYPSRWWIVRNWVTFRINPLGWAYYRARGWIP